MKSEETWLGVGVKSGGQLLFGGVESTGGLFFNLGNPNVIHTFSMTSSRWGFGLGGGAQLVCMFVFKLKGLAWLDGQTIEDWGMNVDMGGRWKHWTKIVDDKFRSTVHAVWALSSIVPHLDEIRDVMHYLYNLYEFDSKGDHPMLSLEVPFAGAGLELSAFKSKGKIWID